MSSKPFVARNLSAAFLAGEWSMAALVIRGAEACGRRERWLRPLVRRVLAAFGNTATGLNPATLARFIREDKSFSRAWHTQGERHRVRLGKILWTPTAMSPAPALRTLPIPALLTPAALADWLGLNLPHLDWFADLWARQADAPAGPLRHYTYQWLATSSGKVRLLEKPKRRMKAIQRRILHEILDKVPAHDAVHGYRKGRSIVTCVAPHAGRRIVLHFDLRDFFPSVRRSRIHALFATLGYPFRVAQLFSGLCTNVVPEEVLQDCPRRQDGSSGKRNPLLFRSAHLPQGAPTSPALANYCTNGLDRRLAALAKEVDARYTRYADDLTFSGDEQLERCARRFQIAVCRIALDEGFEVHTRKTRFMRQGVRQQVGGIILNAHPNFPRIEYDRLKAILFNCVRDGPESQNRDGCADFRLHLAGRVGYVAQLNPSKGNRLRALFDRVRWAPKM